MDGKVGIIIGQRGQGKTILGQSLFQNCHKIAFYISPKAPNWYSNQYVYCRSLADFANSPPAPRYYFHFANTNDYEGSRQEYLDALHKLSKIHNITIFVDEAQLYMNQSYVNPDIYNMISMGRTSGINIILISQRPQQLNPLNMSQSDFLACFNIHNIRDINYLIGSFGAKIEPAELINLPRFSCLIYGEIAALNCL